MEWLNIYSAPFYRPKITNLGLVANTIQMAKAPHDCNRNGI